MDTRSSFVGPVRDLLVLSFISYRGGSAKAR